MKKYIFLIFLIAGFISGQASEWIPIRSSRPSPAEIRLVTSTIDRSLVSFSVHGFTVQQVTTRQGKACTIETGNGVPILESGAPDLPKLYASLVIPDLAGMSVRIVASHYRDFPGMDVAPSKGIILGNKDPGLIPYQYGATYTNDGFFPGKLAEAREPHIVRDLRGLTVWVYPFQYNPVSRVLRIYYDLTLELYKSTETGVNPFLRKDSEIKINRTFASFYTKKFINFKSLRYTPLPDYGSMLVLCYHDFLEAMQPFVQWKNSIGIPTELVDATIAGRTPEEIDAFIENYYYSHGMTFVLLVGDGPQIPSILLPFGRSDNAYTFIVGDDHYEDCFIGRFSAETVQDVNTQVQRTLEYEKNPQFTSDDWYTTVVGIGDDYLPTGDDNEFKFEHIRNLQNQLLGYTYTRNPEFFTGSQGGNDSTGNPIAKELSNVFDEGCGLILYSGHGGAYAWQVGNFTTTEVGSLENQGKLPFIWSMGCETGCYPQVTCFAEYWMRSTRQGQPVGAIAFLGSTILMSGSSAMEGQDVMVEVLTESDPANHNHSFAGISISGCMAMGDAYGQMGQENADTWLVFGDPSVIVRTKNPLPISVDHKPTLIPDQINLVAQCDVDGARVTATISDTILATGLVENNSVILNFPPVLKNGDVVHLVATAYNYIPYIADLPVIQPEGAFIVCNSLVLNDTTPDNNYLLDYAETDFLTLEMKNSGGSATGNVTVNVIAEDPWIHETDSTENYGTFEPGQVKTLANGFAIEVSPDIPDQHPVKLTVQASDGKETWTSFFTLTAHAPVITLDTVRVIDSTSNANGQLDPGETVWIRIPVINKGSSRAFQVTGKLISASPWITVADTACQLYDDIMPLSGSAGMFRVTVDPDAPEGQFASFLFATSTRYGNTVIESFDLPIGSVNILVINMDWNENSAPEIRSAVKSLGLTADYVKDEIPDSLSKYKSIFVCLGVYPVAYELDNSEGQKLADYLNGGGLLYLESGEFWACDWPNPATSLFNIDGVANGSGDLQVIRGYDGTFTEKMSFDYSGDNRYIDRIAAISPAFPIFSNNDPLYDNAVAYDPSPYKTIGSSFEFGGLENADYPSTKINLMRQYLDFFRIPVPALKANFVGFPTEVTAGEVVRFTDFSTGGVVSQEWEFPGGTPAISQDPNPVITYNTPGNFDVRLMVTGNNDTDTLSRAAYIKVKSLPNGTREPSGTTCRVFPNPHAGKFTLRISSALEKTFDISVINNLGSVINHTRVVPLNGALTATFDISDQPDGIYLLLIRGTHYSCTRKIVMVK